nr:hypothetical protein [Tanacetum cinerariifolium]
MPVHSIVKDIRTIDMKIDQQMALDEALVPHASRLRIGKSNLRLRSNITSKESTLQLVYDVLRLTPFYKAFLVTANVPEIYIQEFWATVTVHHHSIRFKMNNKKCIINLEYFREMLYICPRLPNQTFDELSFKEEILTFLRYLGHNGEIRKLTDEDFVYQVEHKDAKKSNEMYYPRFTKVIIHFFMTKDPSIPRRNKFDAILPIELTNEDIKNSAAYKEYYVVASGAAPPKTKASVRKTQSSSDTTITPPTAAGTRLSTLAKSKQPAKFSKAKGLSVLSEVAMTEAEQKKLAMIRSLQQTHISQASGFDKSSDEDDDDDEVDERSDDQEDEDDQDDDDDDNQDDNDDDQDTDNDDDDFVHPKLSIHEEEAKDEESFDPIVQTPENSDDEGNDDASLGLIVGGEEGQDVEDDDEELYRDVNIYLEGIDSLFESTPRVDVQASTTVAPLTLTAPTLLPSTIPTIYQVPQAPTPLTTAPNTVTLKRRRDDADKDEEPSAGSDRGDDDKLYKFKEDDFKRLRIQDIEDMLLFLVQRKLTNLTVEERFTFNVSLRMFTRSIVIQRRVKDLRLGVKSYQKKLNLKKPDTYRSDLKRKEAYTAYSNPKGFIYQNKHKQNRLMRIDELHKFSDGTLNDVQTTLDDHLKRIWMKYLPQDIWRKSDKERAAAMI